MLTIFAAIVFIASSIWLLILGGSAYKIFTENPVLYSKKNIPIDVVGISLSIAIFMTSGVYLFGWY